MSAIAHFKEDPHERRQIMLKLTQMGSDRLGEMRNTTRQKIADLLDELTPEELGHVAFGLTLLVVCLA